jgi:hypothetical protein
MSTAAGRPAAIRRVMSVRFMSAPSKVQPRSVVACGRMTIHRGSFRQDGTLVGDCTGEAYRRCLVFARGYLPAGHPLGRCATRPSAYSSRSRTAVALRQSLSPRRVARTACGVGCGCPRRTWRGTSD